MIVNVIVRHRPEGDVFYKRALGRYASVCDFRTLGPDLTPPSDAVALFGYFTEDVIDKRLVDDLEEIASIPTVLRIRRRETGAEE